MNPSHLYRELMQEELARITSAHFAPAELKDARLMTGGMFNTTYLLTLSDGQQAVLRMGPVNRHLLMTFEHGMMASEAWMYRLCRETGLPVSQVIAVDDSRTIIDRDYMIVKYLPSVPLCECKEAEAVKKRLHRETGRLIRRMHDIRGERFGRASQILPGGGYDTWRDAILAEMEAWMGYAGPCGMYSEEELTAIRETFCRHAPLLDEITVPHLVHADLWAGNVLIEGEGEESRVGAIIDMDRSFFGDPEIDFASGWLSLPAFYEGYGAQPDSSPRAVVRRKLYSLLYSMIDSYVWQAEFNVPGNAQEHRKNVLRLLAELQQ